MKPYSLLAKALLLVFTLAFMLTYTKEQQLMFMALDPMTSGIILSGAFFLFVMSAEWFFSKFSLQQFNTVALGLFFGYLFSLATVQSTVGLFGLLDLKLLKAEQDLIHISLTLLSLYLGVSLTLRAADKLRLSLPFTELTHPQEKSKKILMDASSLSDPRILDLCASGLIDNRLILSTEVLKELNNQLQESDEGLKSKAKQAIENAKKLENSASLGLSVEKASIPQTQNPELDIIKLARKLDANLLTSEITQLQSSSQEDLKIINLNQLSNSLKPLMQTGESIKIKVQRVGKETMQGVGYLEDGTMVVVNGGGEHVGHTVEARVLSVKHTSSGRMIFCNLCEDSAQTISKQTSPYTQGQKEELLVATKASSSQKEEKASLPSQQIKKAKKPSS